MEAEEKLNLLRQKIGVVDGQLLRLLNERADIVLEVDKMKSEIKMESYDPQREEEILRRLVLQNSGLSLERVFHLCSVRLFLPAAHWR